MRNNAAPWMLDMTPKMTRAIVDWSVRIAGIGALLFGGFWLVAWFSGTASSWSTSGAIIVKTNTAVAMGLSGLALLLLSPVDARGSRRWAGVIASALVLLIGVMTLGEHLFGHDLGIDQLLRSEPPGATATISPNRMGPPASTSFVLLGLGLLALATRRFHVIAPYLGLATCLISLVPAVGYLFGIDTFYGRADLTGIAWPTVVMLFLLGIGLILSRSEDGFVALLFRQDAGGALLRRFFPWALLVPVVLGFLRAQGEGAGLFDRSTGRGMLIIALVLFSTVLLWRSAAQLSRSATEIERAQKRLAAANVDLERLHELSSQLIGQQALPALLQAVIDAAIDLTHAHMGTLQLYDEASHSMRIVSHRGFQKPFIDHFAVAHDGPPICNEVLQRRERVIVEDVSTSPLFLGTSTLAVMEAENVRTVQGTIMVSRDGRLLGMIATYWTKRHKLEESTLKLLDLLAHEAGSLIEHHQRSEALRVANTQLLDSDRRKDHFLAVLSHELRNPLAPIRNGVYVLERAPPHSDQAKRALAVIDRQAGQLARLVDDLLDVTRITQNKIQLQWQTLELNKLVRRTVEDLQSVFEKADVHIEFKPAPGPVFVNADGNRLAQVLGNLLQNAAKFTGRGGETRVTIHVDKGKKQAVIRVVDTGAGMAPDMLSRLFQPFSQADATLDRSQGGLGLGLAVAKGLVELLGGEITAHSAGPGKGAELVVRIPLAKEEAPAQQPGVRMTKGCRLLIIEDNIDAADSLRTVLEFRKHEVAVAYDGLEGIAKARSFRPDVVLCDIGLPGMDGYEVARTLRSDEALEGIYLVALSGYALPEDVQRALEAGFDRHLAKPPTLEKLESVVASAPPCSNVAV